MLKKFKLSKRWLNEICQIGSFRFALLIFTRPVKEIITQWANFAQKLISNNLSKSTQSVLRNTRQIRTGKQQGLICVHARVCFIVTNTETMFLTRTTRTTKFSSSLGNSKIHWRDLHKNLVPDFIHLFHESKENTCAQRKHMCTFFAQYISAERFLRMLKHNCKSFNPPFPYATISLEIKKIHIYIILRLIFTYTLYLD